MHKKWITHLVGLLLIVSFQASAVEYQLPDTEGEMQSLDQYKGKWVIVNYWATWCTTCIKELPDLIAFHENNKDKNAVVIGINFESIERKKLKEFITTRSIPFTILSSNPVPKTPLGRVPALPTTYIIDPQGNVVAGEVGIVTRGNLEDYIAQKEEQRNAIAASYGD